MPQVEVDKLKEQYKDVELDNTDNIKRTKNKTIWVAWFQGIENAPLLCQTCVKQMYKVFGKENIVLLDKDNFKEYIAEKIENKTYKILTPALILYNYDNR